MIIGFIFTSFCFLIFNEKIFYIWLIVLTQSLKVKLSGLGLPQTRKLNPKS